jgi:hypothetical protein
MVYNYATFIFQNPQLVNQLRQRRGENFSEMSMTVCSGLDMVNINLNHFVFANKEVLEVEMKMKAYFLTHLLLVPDSEIAHDMS